MRRKILIGTAIVALGMSACSGYGSDDDAAPGESALIDSTETPEQGETDVPPEGAEGSDILGFATTEIGDVLTDSEGFTLYGLTDDSKIESTCYDDCADKWPPLLVASAELPGGLDPNRFSVIERDDGTYQLVAGNYPLYRFADDEQPGDTNGQGVGGIWFAMHPSGVLLTEGADTDIDGDQGDSGSEGDYGDDSDYGQGSEWKDDLDQQMEDMRDEMNQEMGNDDSEGGYDYGS